MKYFILALLVFNFSLAQQEGEKVSRQISLVEKYTADDFTVPEKVMFYSGGNYELSENYKSLFKRLEKNLSKKKKEYKYVYNAEADFPENLKSFDDLDIKFNNEKYDAICVLLLGEVEMSKPDQTNGDVQMFVNKKPEYYYDFYLILVQANTNKILLKRKYHVTSLDLFKKYTKELSKVITNEFSN